MPSDLAIFCGAVCTLAGIFAIRDYNLSIARIQTDVIKYRIQSGLETHNKNIVIKK